MVFIPVIVFPVKANVAVVVLDVAVVVLDVAVVVLVVAVVVLVAVLVNDDVSVDLAVEL